MKDQDQEKFAKYLHRVFDKELSAEELSAEEWSELSEILRNNDDARQQYRELAAVHSMLHWQERQPNPFAGGEQSVTDPVNKESAVSSGQSMIARASTSLPEAIEPKRHPIRFTFFSAVLTLAAAILFIVAIFGSNRGLWQNPDPIAQKTQPSKTVARVTGLYEIEWAERQPDLKQSAALKQEQEIRLKSGLMEITFDDGAKVILEGPAEFVANSPASGTLEGGKLVAKVGRSAIGFTIRTASTEIVDLGTEFGVEVDEDQQTTVAVMKGAVQVKSTDTEASFEVFDLRAGESARVNHAVGKVVRRTDVTSRQFTSSLPKPSLTIFSDDFSDPQGTVIEGKMPDVGGPWHQTSGVQLRVNNGVVDMAGDSRTLFADFTKAIGPGDVLILTFSTTKTSGEMFALFNSYAGVSVFVDQREAFFVGDTFVGAFWGVADQLTGREVSTKSRQEVSTAKFTYTYDTGAWSLNLDSGESLIGKAPAHAAINRLRLKNEGTDIAIGSIQVEVQSVQNSSLRLRDDPNDK